MEDQLNQTQENKSRIPQPEEIPLSDKQDAMGAYLMMFASLSIGLPFPAINLLASFVYLQVMKKKSDFVVFNAHQSLISQLFTSVFNIIGFSWFIRSIIHEHFSQEFIIYIIAVAVLNLVYFIVSLVGAAYSAKGRLYYLPIFGPISYRYAFFRSTGIKKHVNTPPRGYEH